MSRSERLLALFEGEVIKLPTSPDVQNLVFKKASETLFSSLIVTATWKETITPKTMKYIAHATLGKELSVELQGTLSKEKEKPGPIFMQLKWYDSKVKGAAEDLLKLPNGLKLMRPGMPLRNKSQVYRYTNAPDNESEMISLFKENWSAKIKVDGAVALLKDESEWTKGLTTHYSRFDGSDPMGRRNDDNFSK